MARSLTVHLPTALWSALVAFLLLAPESGAPTPEWLAWLELPGADKAVHAALFFVQAWLVGRSLRALPPPSPAAARPAVTAAIVAALYGLLLESAQLAVDGRAFEALDLVANTAGAVLGALVVARGQRA